MLKNFELLKNSLGKYQFYLKGNENEEIYIGSKLSDFKELKILNKTYYITISLVQSNITKNLYVMKKINLSYFKSDKKKYIDLENKIKSLEDINHPQIIKYYTSFKENNNFYIIMEYLNKKSLKDLLIEKKQEGKIIDEKTIWIFLIKSLHGLLYIHEEKKIIHGNIKPCNILIDNENNVKLTDFDSSEIKDENEKSFNINNYKKNFNNIESDIYLNKTYDFKNDIYMLGKTFFYLINNIIPEKNKYFECVDNFNIYKNFKLSNNYSEELRDIILQLLSGPDDIPSTKDAYMITVYYYTTRYLKITSIYSTLQCLLSIPSFSSYFEGDIIKNFIEIDKNSEIKRYIYIRLLKEALDALKQKNCTNFKNAKDKCIMLRFIMYINHIEKIFIPEIELKDFVVDLLEKINRELIKYIDKPINPGKQIINSGIYEEENIDNSDEKKVIGNTIKKFTKNYKSKISEFFFIEKETNECVNCHKNLYYSCDIKNICEMYPEKTAIYLEKNKINIIDLFKHYRKKRKYKYVNEKIYCQTCKTNFESYFKTKIFYFSPNNLILLIDNFNEKEIKLHIDEKINIKDFVEKDNKSEIKYRLVGAIFSKNNEYISISKNEDNKWIYFNGDSFKNCTFNELMNHHKLKMLFYLREYI